MVSAGSGPKTSGLHSSFLTTSLNDLIDAKINSVLQVCLAPQAFLLSFTQISKSKENVEKHCVDRLIRINYSIL